MDIKKITKKINCIVAAFIAALMCITVFAAIPAVAEIGVRIFDYNDYVVEYAVVNEWGNSQNIEIKITNTGSESIERWMLAYNFQVEIHDIWNAEII